MAAIPVAIFAALVASLGLAACSKLAPVPPEPKADTRASTKTRLTRAADEKDEAAACIGPGALQPRADAKNILGGPLAACPSKHVTGFNRNGYCNTGPSDQGVHVVCASVSYGFLTYSRAQGNDLIAARGEFPGLKPGDGWCLCAERWREAKEAGVAPNVYVEATDARALDFIEKSALTSHAQTLPAATFETR